MLSSSTITLADEGEAEALKAWSAWGESDMVVCLPTAEASVQYLNTPFRECHRPTWWATIEPQETRSNRKPGLGC